MGRFCDAFAAAIVLSVVPHAVVAGLLLHCAYEDSADATVAGGPGFAVVKQPTFAPGHEGRALVVRNVDQSVAYVSRGNITKDRGSISMWVQRLWPDGDRNNHALLWEEGPGDPGTNCIWLWFNAGRLRFDVRDPQDSYLVADVSRWTQTEWHHVAATWDCRSGLALYVDGVLVRRNDATWEPRMYPRFFVGRRTRGDAPALCAIDELRLFDVPLEPNQVRAAYEGTLDLPSAASTEGEAQEQRPDSGPPTMLFRLSFDQGLSADVAAGAAEPLTAEGVTRVPALFGSGIRVGEDCRLAFAAAGNLVKESGTLMLWFRPDWSGAETHRENGQEIWRCLFREGPEVTPRHGSNLMWLWFWGARLRVDVSDHQDRYVPHGVGDWDAGQWHHLAVTWDCRRDRVLYLDGMPVGGGADSRKPFLPVTWTPRSFAEFYIGSDGSGRGAEGTIDDVRIYDAPLSAATVRAAYGEVYPVYPELVHRYIPVGTPWRLRFRVRGVADKPATGTLSWTFRDPRGRVLAAGEPTRQRLEFPQTLTVGRDVTIPTAGRYVLALDWEAEGRETYTREVPCWGVIPGRPANRLPEADLELVDDIDCAQAFSSPDRLVVSGEARVAELGGNSYLEAGPQRHDRFAVRVALPAAPGHLYAIDWDYPDDRARTMEMILQSLPGATREYELQTGLFCGAEYDLTNRMLTQRFYVWPRGREIALIFMTAESGRPAAASRIRIYRVNGGLPAADIHDAAPVNGGRRQLGIYYEDPALCYDFGGHDTMPDFRLTATRLGEYMQYAGQNLFMYPGVWYHGPLYPSVSQGTVMQRTHPVNFLELLMLELGSRGIAVILTLNVHDLPTLTQVKWSDDMLSTGSAAETPMMVLWDGVPNLTGWHGTPPNYNPLHPASREAILDMTREMTDLYGDLPAFKGLALHLTKHSMLWFGTLDAGYNDCCIQAFETDTELRIPVDRADPGRAHKRYRWLMAHARDQWVAWRCRALAALYSDMADILRRKRRDLKLILVLYRPNMLDIMAEPRGGDVAGYVDRVNRESGVDTRLYADHPNIVVQRTIYPADYRWYRVHRPWQEDPTEIRDLAMAPAAYRLLEPAAEAWINMHDRYWEDALGRTGRWEAFWGRECGWRVSTLNPNVRHCMEAYAAPLVHGDVMALTKGGFLIGTHGMEPQLASFARVFRALPALPFAEVGRTDSVVVRARADDDRLFVYAVNATPDPAVVTLTIKGQVEAVADVAAEAPLETGANRLSLTVPGYGLRGVRIHGRNLAVSVLE